MVDAMDRVPQERVYLGWPTPALFAQDDAAMDVAATILSDGLSSRLQKALVYDKPLASDVAAFQISLEISGVFVVQATARPGASVSFSFAVERPAVPGGMPAGGLLPSSAMRSRGTPK